MGKEKNINRKDLITVAESMNIKKPNSIIDEISEVVKGWSGFASEQGVNKNLITAIEKTLIIL